MQTWPTLYKLDSKGKVRQWSISVHQEDDETLNGEHSTYCYYQQEHGLQGGKLQKTSTEVLEGKNIGKANETTPWEQCVLEAEALWKKQRDRKGYSETMPTDKPLRPMLAKPYDKEKKKVEFPAIVQPKLDGIRCLAFIRDGQIHLVSRQGKRWTALGHLEDALRPILNQNPDLILDGELYNHDYKDDFQTLVSGIKRDKPSEHTHLIQYHIYDIVCEQSAYLSRLKALRKVIQDDEALIIVSSKQVQCHDGIIDYQNECLAVGYEGCMVRNAEGVYKINGRSSDLLKVKIFIDEEFEIVGAEENKGKQAGQCTFICITEDGVEFGVKPKGSEAVREQYWTDFQAGKLTGKMLTVRFFEWTTSDEPVPRFPIGIAVRDYE